MDNDEAEIRKERESFRRSREWLVAVMGLTPEHGVNPSREDLLQLIEVVEALEQEEQESGEQDTKDKLISSLQKYAESLNKMCESNDKIIETQAALIEAHDSSRHAAIQGALYNQVLEKSARHYAVEQRATLAYVLERSERARDWLRLWEALPKEQQDVYRAEAAEWFGKQQTVCTPKERAMLEQPPAQKHESGEK